MWLSDFRQGVLYVHHHVGVHFFVGVASVSRVPAVNDNLTSQRRIIHPLIQFLQVCDVIRPSIRAALLVTLFGSIGIPIYALLPNHLFYNAGACLPLFDPFG